MKNQDLDFQMVLPFGQDNLFHIALHHKGVLLEQALCGLMQRVMWIIPNHGPFVSEKADQRCHVCLQAMAQLVAKAQAGEEKSRGRTAIQTG